MVNFNPQATTVASGSFSVASDGLIQGTALDNPSARFQLAGGWLAADETIPMWGGVGIYENIPGVAGETNPVLGQEVGRATALTGSKALVGFSVFDQNHAAINWPQSPVPTASPGMMVNLYRLHSNARIAVKASAGVAALVGSPIGSNVSWDYSGQQLTVYSAPTFASGSYNTSSGNVTLVTTGAHGLVPGDIVVISGAAGSGSYAAVNGVHTLITGTTGSTLVFTIDTGLTITLSGATIDTGGILPVRVLQVSVGKSMTVAYDSVSGNTTWNRAGTVAIIELS